MHTFTVDQLLAARRPRRESNHNDNRPVNALGLEHLSANELAGIARTGQVEVITTARIMLGDHTLVALNRVALDARLACTNGEIYAEALYLDLPRWTGWHRVVKRKADPVIVIM